MAWELTRPLTLCSTPHQGNHNKSRSLGGITKALIATNKSSSSRPLLTPRQSRRQLEAIARPQRVDIQ
jgi:hypothetical protein